MSGGVIHPFTDVPDDRFFSEPVQWAFENDITTGTSPTTFSPEAPVTRAQMVTLLRRYHEAFVNDLVDPPQPPPDPNADPNVTNPGAQSDTEGDVISLQIVASDPDSDPIGFAASGLPGGLSINSTGLISGTLASDAADSSPYSVTVTVTDDTDGETEVSFTWTVSEQSVGLTYGTFEYPFSSSSVWNTALASSATLDTVGPHVHQESQNFFAAGYNQTPTWGHPLYEASSSDDLFTATFQVYVEDEVHQGPSNPQFRIPSSAQPDTQADGHLHVLDEDGVTLWDIYAASIDHGANTISTGVWAHRTRIDGSGIGTTSTGVGTRAYGGASIAGMVRKHELDDGVIHHRIALMLPLQAMREDDVAFMWPATRKDSFGYDNPSWGGHMGECFRIPPSVDVSSLGLSATAEIVAKALQDYGGHVVDQSGSTSIAVFDLESNGVYSMSGADCTAIANELRRVTSVTAGNPTGAV